MNFNLTEKFGANIGEAWKEEYQRIGSIYARWGALLVIFLFPLSIIPEISIEKSNLLAWYVFRLGPSFIMAAVFLLHQKYKFSHELLFEIIAFCLFSSAAYMVECGDWITYVVSMGTVFFTSAVLVILRPFYFIINFLAVLLIQVIVNMIFCDMGVADYFLMKGVNILIVVGITCFSIAALRYYILKNNFMHRVALQEAHFALQERNQSLIKVQNDLRFKSVKVGEQNEELMLQKEEISAQRDAMQTQKDYIEKQNRDILSSIRYAKRIQTAMLPSEDLLSKFFPESFIYFVPKDIISGDFYWIAKKDGKLILAVVDCTGHGVPGAFMSLIGQSNLAQIVLQQGVTSPAEILKQLHTGIITSLNQDETDNQDGMDAGIIVIDEKIGAIEFAGAKIPLICLNSQKGLLEIKGDKQSIGGIESKEKNVQFTQHHLAIERDTTYYLFSDGFPDQFGGPSDKKFMVSQFKKLLQKVADKSLQDQKFIMRKNFEDWKSNSPQTDDVLVLGFRVH
jgi:serine phosphatase RsbU (regulator of sigma subunit)